MSQSWTLSSYFALFLVFISGVGFSVQSLLIKILEEGGWKNSLQILFLRGLFQSTVSYLLITTRGIVQSNQDLYKIVSNSSRILCLGSLLSFGGIACIFLTTEFVPVGFAMILDRQSIIFSSIFAFIFLGEPWLLREFMATVLSMCGIVMIADPDVISYALHGFHHSTSSTSNNSVQDVHVIGFLYGFLAALFAAGSYTTVRAMGTVSPVAWEVVTFLQGTVQVLFSLPLMWLRGGSFTVHLTVSQWSMVAAAVVIGTLSQYAQTLGKSLLLSVQLRSAWCRVNLHCTALCVSIGMQREKLAVANTIRTSDVMFALLWQQLFTRDVVSTVELIGSVFVLVGILVIIVYRDGSHKDQRSGGVDEGGPRRALKSNIAYSPVPVNQFDEL
jgi:drug/metabolite transporter (DMT)-like permease